jgi:hypothetical protein
VFTKRKKHINKEKLGIIDRLKRGDSEASLFREFGIPEGIIHGGMRDKNNLRLFVNQVDDKLDLDRKKADAVM